jgi:bifunctional NMN adenylyltransferase/nudix hydrolase
MPPNDRTALRTIDALVFIGCLQPFQSGNLAVIRHAFSQSDRVLLLCGSARQPRSTRNPWIFDQVVAMVRACMAEEESDRVTLAPVLDHLYNQAQRVRLVQQTAADLLRPRGPGQGAARRGLIGVASSGSGSGRANGIAPASPPTPSDMQFSASGG